MADQDIIGSIDSLMAEERELRTRSVGAGLSPEEQRRMNHLEQQLDQCWDLLRQRRARREVGENPEGSAVRPASEVESYRQ
ncbi:MAG TPA: DUF2630 family protein [Pseudonocardiaceae bacterium]